MDDTGPTGAKPAEKDERASLWAAVTGVGALAALVVEVKRPDIVRGALDLDVGVSSILLGVIATVLCAFAVRRSPLRALPGIVLAALYWVLLVVAVRR